MGLFFGVGQDFWLNKICKGLNLFFWAIKDNFWPNFKKFVFLKLFFGKIGPLYFLANFKINCLFWPQFSVKKLQGVSFWAISDNNFSWVSTLLSSYLYNNYQKNAGKRSVLVIHWKFYIFIFLKFRKGLYLKFLQFYNQSFYFWCS